MKHPSPQPRHLLRSSAPRKQGEGATESPLPILLWGEGQGEGHLDLHSLQKENRAEDETFLNANPGLIKRYENDLEDFSDTAALIEQMDLVIAVDTSVAHLAGAMGKPVWILLPFAPDYRWMLDRSDSPWYPTARLFRQSKINDWSNVFAEIRDALLTRP